MQQRERNVERLTAAGSCAEEPQAALARDQQRQQPGRERASWTRCCSRARLDLLRKPVQHGKSREFFLDGRRSQGSRSRDVSVRPPAAVLPSSKKYCRCRLQRGSFQRLTPMARGLARLAVGAPGTRVEIRIRLRRGNALRSRLAVRRSGSSPSTHMQPAPCTADRWALAWPRGTPTSSAPLLIHRCHIPRPIALTAPPSRAMTTTSRIRHAQEVRLDFSRLDPKLRIFTCRSFFPAPGTRSA